MPCLRYFLEFIKTDIDIRQRRIYSMSGVVTLEFIETSFFTKEICCLISDSEYKEIQEHLRTFPTAGDIIPGVGGIRKLRWTAKGHGKRGGMRLIYYYIYKQSQIYMLSAYPKNTKDDLTQHEKKYLKKLIEGFENG